MMVLRNSRMECGSSGVNSIKVKVGKAYMYDTSQKTISIIENVMARKIKL